MRYLSALAILTFCSSGQAHFLWLVPEKAEDGQSTINVYFGENGQDDSPDYLSFVEGIALHQVVGTESATDLTVTSTDGGMTCTADLTPNSVVVAAHDAGVTDRGDSVFRLKYYAKAGPAASDSAWQNAKTADDLRLNIVPRHRGDKLQLKVTFDGKPLAAAQVKVITPSGNEVESSTNKKGAAGVKVDSTGLYSIRVRHVEAVPGELDGKKYPEVRHYSTIALDVSKSDLPVAVGTLRNLPQPVTSFGAAITGGSLYMYGGHTGGAHSYSKEEQANELIRLDLKTGEWTTIVEGPHLQGLALVTHGGQLFRLGGFTAENTEGEDHRLVSQDLAARFDPAVGKWEEIPALPECRSSHDAAVVGESIYVVGGWSMHPEDGKTWHETAWKMDLTKSELSWEAIAKPPFQRRAVALAAHGGKLYVVGGMQSEGGPTTKVAVYDPDGKAWSEGPPLVVKDDPAAEEEGDRMSSGAMTGFGASAFSTGGRLYVTTVQGTLQRLSKDGRKWKVLTSDLTPRFFHRLLPIDESRLLAVGGANMSIGKFEEVDVINVSNFN